MRKWILMLVCVLTLSALSVCFAEDSDNSGEVTAQQSYVNEAITVTSEISADAPSQSPVLRDVAYMTQGGRQLIIKLYDIDSDYDVSRLAEPDFEEGGLLYTHKNSIKVSDNRTMETKQASQTATVSHTENNGHARADIGYDPVSRQSNLVVESSDPKTEEELRQLLIAEIKKQGKDRGYFFKSVTGGFTMTNRRGANAFNVTPLEVYEVYADGRPDKLVRKKRLI